MRLSNSCAAYQRHRVKEKIEFPDFSFYILYTISLPISGTYVMAVRAVQMSRQNQDFAVVRQNGSWLVEGKER